MIADTVPIVLNTIHKPTDVTALSGAPYGQGVGSIFLDDVDCEGSEFALIFCSHNGIGNQNCAHHEDAGVRCQQINNTNSMLSTQYIEKFLETTDYLSSIY